MEPASTVLFPSAVSEGEPIFPTIWWHLLRRFPVSYAPSPNTCGPLGPDYLGYPKVALTPTTLGLQGPDYLDGSQVDRAPERRDRDVVEEGGGG